MNATYRVLWIDDSSDFTESTIELIEMSIRDNNLRPEVKVYNDYTLYKESELERFDQEVFCMYDQIVVDYSLSGTTGDELIRDLRSRGVFTDIVFYSSNYGYMIRELKKSEQLDGVFWTDRNDLTRAINRVIKKSLRREYSIANIRGLIMDSSSEFDFICREATIELFDKLNEVDQNEVILRAKEYVASASSNMQNSFTKLEKCNGKRYLCEVMRLVDYVISNKNRYELMALVVGKYDHDNMEWSSFADEYDADIIHHRNKLAHNKLVYGPCSKKLRVIKKRGQGECTSNCDECDSPYDMSFCENLRKSIYRYSNQLDKVDGMAKQE